MYRVTHLIGIVGMFNWQQAKGVPRIRQRLDNLGLIVSEYVGHSPASSSVTLSVIAPLCSILSLKA